MSHPPEISQEAARQMLAALRELTRAISDYTNGNDRFMAGVALNTAWYRATDAIAAAQVIVPNQERRTVAEMAEDELAAAEGRA